MNDPLAEGVRRCGDYMCRCCDPWEAEVKRLRAQSRRGWNLAVTVGNDLELLREAVIGVARRTVDDWARAELEKAARLDLDGCQCGHASSSHGSVITRCTICDCEQFDGEARA